MRCTFRYAALTLAMLSIVSCASGVDDQALFESTLNPTPPNQLELEQARQNLVFIEEPQPQAVRLPKPQLKQSVNSSPRQFERPTPSVASQFISIMGQDGTVITVWALARRNWLWGYAPMDSRSFGTIRNWKIERGFTREHFRFVNQRLGTCMQAYGNGIIHDTCNKRNFDQAFELMPTNTGSVFIKSVSQQRCITYDPVNKNDFDTLTLAACDDNTTPFRDQNWYLAPPLLPATPEKR